MKSLILLRKMIDYPKLKCLFGRVTISLGFNIELVISYIFVNQKYFRDSKKIDYIFPRKRPDENRISVERNVSAKLFLRKYIFFDFSIRNIDE